MGGEDAARGIGAVRLAVAGVAAVVCVWPAASAAHAQGDGAYPGNGSWQPGPMRYGMVEERTRLRMSDGITLAATITRPADPATGRAAPGRFPVVLAITPYGKDIPGLEGGDVNAASWYVPRGYVYVLVDTRGTGGSNGQFELLGPREVRDYVETIDWAARLPGTEPRVGMVGISYLGMDQLFAAAAVGPDSPLEAIFPIAVPVDLYRDLVVPGGIFNNLFDTPYAALEVGLVTLGPLFSGQGPQQITEDLAHHLAGAAEIDGRTFADAMSRGDRAYDSAFYGRRSVTRALARIPRSRVPTFIYQPWFDIYSRGTALTYVILQNAAAGRRALSRMPARAKPSPRFQVAIGPYAHGFWSERMFLLSLEWFDTWLKGERTGMDRTATPLHAYEVMGGRWTELTTWPPRGARAREWFFGEGRTGTAVNSLNDGRLGTRPEAQDGDGDVLPYYGGVNVPCSRATDQELLQGPVKAYGDIFGNRWENPCTFDDRGFETGALTYTTPPLQRPLTIAGPGNVTVYAESTRPNTEWVVTLNDVAPDGRARPLATGDLLGSHRALDTARSWMLNGRMIMPWHPFTRAEERPVERNALTRYDIELPGILARIAKGHRIRVTVNSSYRPYLEPTMPHQSELFGGRYAVRRHMRARSRVTLTVIDPDRLRASTTGWGPCITDCGPPRTRRR